MIAGGLLAVVIVLLVASDAQAKIPANRRHAVHLQKAPDISAVKAGATVIDAGLPFVAPLPAES